MPPEAWPAGRMVHPTPAAEPPLHRFDRRTRVLHWVNATMFGVLMLTGAALYAGPISQIVGNREIVRFVHVYTGLALPIPLLLAIAGARGARVRRDLGRLNRWSGDDARWFRRHGRRSVRLGKFNPGQKLNAAFIAGAGIVMLATGSIMHWFDPFPLDWRTGATFVHDWFALGIWLAVIGHIVFALRDGDALEGMLKGDVPADWARRKAPRWYDEERPGNVAEAIPSSASGDAATMTTSPVPSSSVPSVLPSSVLDALDDDLDAARAELDALVRIPSISADCRARCRRAGDRGRGRARRCASRACTTSGSSRSPAGSRTSSASGTAPGRTRRRCCCTRTTTSSPPGYVDRWTSDPFAPRSRAGGSSVAAPPTTRRARSRTSPRCERGCGPRARCRAT